MPFILALVMELITGDYLTVLTTHPIGLLAVYFALALQAIGALWIRHMIRLDV